MARRPRCLECRESSTGRCRRHRAMPIVGPDAACPRCGGRLDVISAPDGFVVDRLVSAGRAGLEVVERPRLAPFVACVACEFCAEVDLTKGTSR